MSRRLCNVFRGLARIAGLFVHGGMLLGDACRRMQLRTGAQRQFSCAGRAGDRGHAAAGSKERIFRSTGETVDI